MDTFGRVDFGTADSQRIFAVVHTRSRLRARRFRLMPRLSRTFNNNMGATRTGWKRAPRDQRRLATERSAPNARFTRSQRSGSLPASLNSRDRRWLKPLLLVASLVTMVGLSVALVIAVGAYIRAEQQTDEMHERASYYGLPTQPFSTLAPDQPEQSAGDASIAVRTYAPMMTTPLPLIGVSAASSSSSDTAQIEPGNAASDRLATATLEAAS